MYTYIYIYIITKILYLYINIKTKNWFYKMINKTDKPLARLTKIKLRNEREVSGLPWWSSG